VNIVRHALGLPPVTHAAHPRSMTGEAPDFAVMGWVWRRAAQRSLVLVDEVGAPHT
jgi:hypothetical protein